MVFVREGDLARSLKLCIPWSYQCGFASLSSQQGNGLIRRTRQFMSNNLQLTVSARVASFPISLKRIRVARLQITAMPFIEAVNELKATHTPNYDTYMKRRKLLELDRLLQAEKPVGFAGPVASPSVWSEGTLKINKVTYELKPAEILEIEGALQAFKSIPASLLLPLTAAGCQLRC